MPDPRSAPPVRELPPSTPAPCRCLFCHRAMEGQPWHPATCAHCHRTTLPSDRRRYWTRNPRIIRRERLLKAGVVAVAAMLGYLVMGDLVTKARFMSAAAGAGLALPIPFAIALWLTASKLTAYVPMFRPAIFWGASFAIAAASWPLWVSVLVERRLVQLDERTLQALGIGVGLALAIGSVAGSRLGVRWRARTMATPLED